jgi:hypothetical protein
MQHPGIEPGWGGTTTGGLNHRATSVFATKGKITLLK